MKRWLSMLLMIGFLTACGGDETESRDLLAPQRDALERAEGVEQVIDEAAERQRRQIEEQGG
ncbi:MAG: hypothetical protein ACOCVP_01855 [Wenzhouxiangella sp.]